MMLLKFLWCCFVSILILVLLILPCSDGAHNNVSNRKLDETTLFSSVPSFFTGLNKDLLEVFVQAIELSSIVEFVGDPNRTIDIDEAIEDLDVKIFLDEPDKAMVTKIRGICFGVFRATTPSLIDWTQNLNPLFADDVCAPPPNDRNCCRSRQGFRNAYFLPSYRTEFEEAIRECATTNIDYCTKNVGDGSICDVVLTGASQGGAVATVAMAALGDLNPTLVSFGQPPVMERGDECINSVVNPSRMYRFVSTLDVGGRQLAWDPVPFLDYDFASLDNMGNMFVLSDDDDSNVAYYRDGEDPNVGRNHWALQNVQQVHSYLKYLARIEALHDDLVSSSNAAVGLEGWAIGTTCSTAATGLCEAQAVCNLFDNTCTSTSSSDCVVETATLNSKETINNAMGEFFDQWNNALTDVDCSIVARTCTFDFRQYSSDYRAVCSEENGQFIEGNLGLKCTGRIRNIPIPGGFNVAMSNLPACVSRACNDQQLLPSDVSSAFSSLLRVFEIGIEAALGVECEPIMSSKPEVYVTESVEETFGIKLINVLNRQMNDNETMIFEQTVADFMNGIRDLTNTLRVEIVGSNVIGQIVETVDDNDSRLRRRRHLASDDSSSSNVDDAAESYSNVVVTRISALQVCGEVQRCEDIRNGMLSTVFEENYEEFLELLLEANSSITTYFSDVDNVTIERNIDPEAYADDRGMSTAGMAVLIVVLIIVLIVLSVVGYRYYYKRHEGLTNERSFGFEGGKAAGNSNQLDHQVTEEDYTSDSKSSDVDVVPIPPKRKGSSGLQQPPQIAKY